MAASEEIKEGFDTTVHVRDPRSGRLVKENHYALHVVGGMQLYERDGKYFWPNGEEASHADVKEVFPEFKFKETAPSVIDYKKATKSGSKSGAKSS